MKYIVILNKAKRKLEEDEEEKKLSKKPPKNKEPDEGEEEEGTESEVDVGHVILVPGTEKEAEVTAVGKDGVTAKDEGGNKYLIRRENLEPKDEEGEEEGKDKDKDNDSLKDKMGKNPDDEEEEVSVEDYLKKEQKEGDWIQASTIAKLMDVDPRKVKKELKKLEEKGLIQYVTDNKWGDILYKYTGAERSKDEAKPNKYGEAKGEEEKEGPDKKEDPIVSEFKKISGWKFDESWVVPDPKHDDVYLVFTKIGEKKYKAAIFYRKNKEFDEVGFKEAAEKYAPKELKKQMKGKEKKPSPIKEATNGKTS